jgi:hypothetical protein
MLLMTVPQLFCLSVMRVPEVHVTPSLVSMPGLNERLSLIRLAVSSPLRENSAFCNVNHALVRLCVLNVHCMT